MKTTVSDLVKLDGNLILAIGCYNNFSSIGDNCYMEICGGFIEGVYQWFSHNIVDIDECENEKYVGWTFKFDLGVDGEIEKKMVIPQWVMKKELSDWKHAKNLFVKYLRVVQ